LQLIVDPTNSWHLRDGLCGSSFLFVRTNFAAERADAVLHDEIEAADAVRRETGEKKCNVLGYCVGGTLLGATLAYLAAKDEAPFQSATFLTAQVDFTKAGDLKLFIDEQQLKNIEEMMAERGYLDGSRMATVFNMLRPRDLIWPYIINNYMLGKDPMPFDLLYWNADSTRMPAGVHSFYLRECYMANKLSQGKMVLDNVRIDLKKVKCCNPCLPPIQAVLHVTNPCTCCPVDVPVCLPNCCCDAPKVECRKTLLGDGVVTYSWCCGFSASIRFQPCGNVLVTYRGN